MSSLDDPAAHLATLDCVHCGLCIESCPTYRLTGRESAGPRGRVYLMRAFLENRVESTPEALADLDLCLVCRACETSCPSGVRYAEVIAHLRSQTRRRGILRRLLMDAVLPHPRRLHFAATLLRLHQRTLGRVLAPLLPPRLRRMQAMLPEIPRGSERSFLPEFTPARGERLGTVGFLQGCVMSQLFPGENRATVRLLAAAGFDVVCPPAARCCGALHEHDGALTAARALAAEVTRAFAGREIRALVTNSAGCGAAVAEYGHRLEEDDARALASRAVDVTRFLLDHGERLRFAPLPLRVTYDAPCHLHHAQQESSAPLEVLRRIPELEIIPLEDSERCCGAAGIYNLDHPRMSDAILAEKLDALERTGAEVLLSGNPGCLLQWRSGIRSRGLRVRADHPVILLARALSS